MEYALYKGDEILAIGTIKEIAKETGVKVDTVKYYLTPSYLERIKARKKAENYRIMVKLEEEE